MSERSEIEVEWQYTGEPPKKMGEIIKFLNLAFLKQKETDPERYFYEFEISGEIEPVDIQSLLKLAIEIALTERNGKVVLTTGTTKAMGLEHEYLERIHHSRLSFHTHPDKGELSLTVPGFGDIYRTDFTDSSTPLIVAYEKGMTVYRKPVFNPMTGEKFAGEARQLMLAYGKAKGIDIFGFERDPNLKPLHDMPRQEQNKLQRQFAEDTKLIVTEASWEDEKGIAGIMDYINLKK